jgi:hypothetical protein
VYTERPACPDIWYFQKFVEKGCKTELKEVENLQRQRLWDVGDNPELEPYALRDDLPIVVFSTFSSAAEIGAAAFFAPIRREIWMKLQHDLIALYQDAYAAESNEEYDIREYEEGIPARAGQVADELPSWNDYVLELDRGGAALFRKNLEQEAAELFAREKASVSASGK